MIIVSATGKEDIKESINFSCDVDSNDSLNIEYENCEEGIFVSFHAREYRENGESKSIIIVANEDEAKKIRDFLNDRL